MVTRQLVLLGASLFASVVGVPVSAQQAQDRYIQIADIDIDPAQRDAYQAAVKEQIESAIRSEPGVLTLYAVSDRDHPERIRVFEIYSDIAAYKSHLESAHFKKYKAAVERIVRSLTLTQVSLIALGEKSK